MLIWIIFVHIELKKLMYYIDSYLNAFQHD